MSGGRNYGCGAHLTPWRAGLGWVLHVPEHDTPAVTIIDDVALCATCVEALEALDGSASRVARYSIRRASRVPPPDASDAGVLPDGAVLIPLRSKREPRSGLNATQRRVQQLYARDGQQCWYCGKPLLALPLPVIEKGRHLPHDYPTIDEVIPRSKGGRRTLANQRVACLKCNTHKGDAEPERALKWMTKESATR